MFWLPWIWFWFPLLLQLEWIFQCWFTYLLLLFPLPLFMHIFCCSSLRVWTWCPVIDKVSVTWIWRRLGLSLLCWVFLSLLLFLLLWVQFWLPRWSFYFCVFWYFRYSCLNIIFWWEGVSKLPIKIGSHGSYFSFEVVMFKLSKFLHQHLGISFFN